MCEVRDIIDTIFGWVFVGLMLWGFYRIAQPERRDE